MRSVFNLNCLFFILVLGLSGNTYAQITSSPMWTWMGSDVTATAVYGTKGVFAPENNPGPRTAYITWLDANDNIYLFGGSNSGGSAFYLADLWKYDVTLGQWAFIGGRQGQFTSTAGSKDTAIYGTLGVAHADNRPGARNNAGAFTDKQGNLWLFGGWGFDKVGALSVLNDVWKYDISSGLWTWMGGDNIVGQIGVYGTTRRVANPVSKPGARQQFTSFQDDNNGLWIYGGVGYPGKSSGSATTVRLNDLWRFDMTTGLWTWFSGDTTKDIKAAVYGQYQLPSVDVRQPRRSSAMGMIDADSSVWIFAGIGQRGGTTAVNVNTADMWKYDVKNDVWGWMAGDSMAAGPGRYGQKGVYDAANYPGARRDETFSGWDKSRKYMIIYGGYGLGYTNATGGTGNVAGNVMWQFNTQNNQFAWIGGDTTGSPVEVLGTKGVASPTNNPGVRAFTRLMVGRYGNLWMYGGRKGAATTTYGSVWVLDGCTAAPAAPVAFISAPDTLCYGAAAEIYKVQGVENVRRYTWTLPTGWTGTSNYDTIAVQPDATSGIISVTAENSCGQSQPLTRNVHVPALPTTPASIAGNTSLCPGTAEEFKITSIAGVKNYTWTLPQGWTGTSTDTSIQVIVGSAGTGSVTVRANNRCGSSTEQILAITVVGSVQKPDLIQGKDTLCVTTDQVYRIPAVSGALSYEWTVPNDLQGNSTADSIQITTGTTFGSYTIKVSSIGQCDTSDPQTLDIWVAEPPVASVTYSNSMLTVVGGTGLTYQWYLDGVAINSATGVIHRAAKNGYYHVLVTNRYGCTDTAGYRVTDVIPQTVGELNGTSANGVLYPNPAKDLVYIKSSNGKPVSVQVLSVDGKRIATHNNVNSFEVGKLPEGVYFIHIQDNSGRVTSIEKLVKVL